MWGFGSITNLSEQVLMFDYAVAANSGRTSGAALNGNRGNAVMEVGALGAVMFTDVGHRDGGPHYWCVQVTWNSNTAYWYYDGGGVLDVQVGGDGSFTLTGQGETITGNLADGGPALASASHGHQGQ